MASLSNVTPKFDVNKAIKYITDYKTEWHKADKAGDTQAMEKYKNLAQRWYTELENNGYSDVATTLHNTNDVGARAFYDSYIKNNTPTSTTTTTTTTTTPKHDTTTIGGKNNTLFDSQMADKETLTKKYDYLEDYNINYNPYEDAIGKSIMANYKYQGDVASDNAVAEGGASNGGNIDSYASANANRQQLAFTNAGNQAILNDFNARVDRYRGILNDMGINLRESDKGIQTTIGIQQSEEQRQFDNSETSKNNQVARDVETSKVTGYVPESISYDNNPYLDENGNVIDPENRDFSLIKYNAEQALKTETDPKKRAHLEWTIKWADQAREIKTRDERWAQYANTTTAVAPDRTADYTLSENQINSTERMNSDDNATTLAVTGMNNETDITTTGMNNATDIYGYNTSLEGTKYTADSGVESARISSGENGSDIDALVKAMPSNGAKNFVLSKLAPYFEMDTVDVVEVESSTNKDSKGNVVSYGTNGNELPIKTLLIQYKDAYHITQKDAEAILTAFQLPFDWIDNVTWYTYN